MKHKLKKKFAFVVGVALLATMPLVGYAAEPAEQEGASDSSATGTAQTVVSGDQVNAASVGASIQGGSQNTAVGNSILIVNNNPGAVNSQGVNVGTVYGALIFGGSGNTAIGVNAQAVGGSDDRAVGYGAFAGNGNHNTAIGNQSYAGGGVLAGREFVSGENLAVGYQAQAYGGSAVAIGAFSVANEPNTVSVGQPGYERRITNVAPGIYDTDAVNVSQLRNTESRIDRLGATAMAMSGLAPMGYNPKQPTQYSAAVGTYNGKTGFAFGVYHYTHENVMLSAAVGWSKDGWEKAGRMSVTWWTGSAKDKKVQDNTIYGSNLPGSNSTTDKKLADGKAAEPGNDIQSRVKRLINGESN